MATKLGIYNAALVELGQRTISSLAEDTESRRILDVVYDDVVAECLEAGQWNFAIRTVKLTGDTGLSGNTNFGFSEVHGKPSDWCRTAGISFDEYNNVPLTDSQYKDEVNNIYTDSTPIYLRYVSTDASYGYDLTKWTQKFARYVALELAGRTCMRITQSDGLHRDIFELTRRAKRDALNKDALNEGTRFRLPGNLVMARVGYGSNRERGSTSKLTG